jgi:hypothetical protein
MTRRPEGGTGARRGALLGALKKLQLADCLLERLLARQRSASPPAPNLGQLLSAQRELREALALLRMRLN